MNVIPHTRQAKDPKDPETNVAWLWRKTKAEVGRFLKRQRRRRDRALSRLLRRIFRMIVARGGTSLPFGTRRSEYICLEMGSYLLRRAELGETHLYFKAFEFFQDCSPTIFLTIIEDRLQAVLECLVTCGDAGLVDNIAASFADAGQPQSNPRRALLIACACMATGNDKRARELLESKVAELLGAGSVERLTGVYGVRSLFPPHWSRRDPPGMVTFADPLILGRSTGNYVTLPLPFQQCAIVENAYVFGEFNISDRDKNLLIYDHAGHPRLPHVAGNHTEIKGSAMAMDKAVVYRPYLQQIQLSSAIHIAGRCASNYFHWMIEYLPRLITAEEAGIEASAPLLVPAGMPRSMRQALKIVNERKFPVHEFLPTTLLDVDRLYVPSMHTCIVDGRALPLSTIGAVSPHHLHIVRDRILKHVAQLGGTNSLPRKVLLLRGNRGRALRTEEEIRIALVAEGFEAVDPTDLEFEDQVRLFRDADAIVSASGAALTNLLFCERRPDVFALIGSHITDFNLFSNILPIAGGGQYSQVPGRPLAPPVEVVNEDHYIHVDYRSSLKDVLTSIAILSK